MEELLLLAAMALGAAAAGAGVLIGRHTGPAPVHRHPAQAVVDSRLETILANIDLYDGTGDGQQPVGEE